MSIYAVPLLEWYPPGDEMYENALMSMALRCNSCGAIPRYSKAVGDHSIPWGFGDVFCDWKCYHSDRVWRGPDKRQLRRAKRRFKEFINVP